MDNPAQLSDVTAVIERPLTSDEQRVIPAWLGTAWRILLREVPSVAARNALPASDPDHLDTNTVKDVVVAMVERKVRNPDGRRQWQGDDYSETVDAALSTGQLYVTPAELGTLTSRAYSTPGVYSLPLG